jgi:hypothetical protein
MEETVWSDMDADNFLGSANSDKQHSALPRRAIRCLRLAHLAQFPGNDSISGSNRWLQQFRVCHMRSDTHWPLSCRLLLSALQQPDLAISNSCSAGRCCVIDPLEKLDIVPAFGSSDPMMAFVWSQNELVPRQNPADDVVRAVCARD